MRCVVLVLSLATGLLFTTACGDSCVDGAADCDGDALVCLDGQWSVQETCDADEVCEIEAGVAFCMSEDADPAPADSM
jgi:hypothetical protein